MSKLALFPSVCIHSILKRWREHFDELLNRPSAVEEDFLNSIPTRPVKEEVAACPSFSKTEASVKKKRS